ncbi:leishmanolysin-related zinc metalloendopeptidase [Candidatus Palauibacter sp.]|uniref:leishmanolysin-related zinc metalloendopeptidase n=1 Tax=Candidatus Palauibacter sp. TaxID=3101350 RepID=UPI003B0188C5
MGPAPPAPPPLEPNRPPTAVGAIPGQSARVGDTVALTVSSYFADPDGDRLGYDARSSDPGVATVSTAGDTVTVVAVRRGAAAITVTAADPDGLEASQPFEVTVLNSGPAADGRIPDLESPLGREATVEVSPYFTDPDGDSLTYRAESSDPAVAAAAAAGSELTIRALARGAATITVTAADPDGLEATLDFEVTVPNSGPAANGSLADLELRRGDAATVDLSSHFTDPDGDVLTYRAESSDPAVAAAVAAGSELTIRALARGSTTITVTASDPGGLEAALAFEVTVPNSGPVATGTLADIELAGGQETTVEVVSLFTDPDGDVLTYRAESSDPAVAAADTSGSVVTVGALARGAATITVTAADPDGLEAALDFEVTVPNSGPAAGGSLADLELRRGDAATVDLSSRFTDPDGDVLTYRAESSDPAVAAADTSGSVVTVGALARGAATITVTAADPDGLEATLDFEVTVPNSGPVTGGRIPDLELAPGVSRSVDVSPYFSDPDGDPLTYAAGSSNPDVATATASGDSVAVLALARGTATITVTATDPDGLEATLEFEVTVPGGGPVTAGRIPDLELAPGVRRSVDVSPYFSDPDGDPLTFAARSSNPDVATATASGDSVAVLALARGTATITVTASDPDGLQATLEFELTVPGGGPVTAGRIPDLELAPGASRSVDVSPYFSDPDGDPLTYAAGSSNPDVATATASGDSVAVLALARGTATITVTASDPDGLQATLEFELTVPGGGPVTAGRIPDLELAPGASRSVDVSPYFSDPDGDPLTYAAGSSNPDVATATASGDSVAVLALARGTATITVTASDPDGLQATLEFELTVPGGGPVTVGRIPDLELAPGVRRSVDVSPYFSDPDGDPLTYAAGSSNPDVATATASGDSVAVLALTRGTATITVTATDPDGLQATLEFELTVPGGGPVTVGRIPDLELAPGVRRSVDVSPYFSDPDGDPLTFAARSSNPDVATATASGDSVAVLALARGTATITVTASDPDGLEATLEFELTVPGGGPVTVGRIPDLELAPGVRRSVDVSPYFSDPDGDPLTFAARSSNPDVATATASGDSVAVLALARGTATITVTASDPDGLQATLEFEVTVLAAPNRPPGISATLPDLDLEEGEDHMLLLSRFFSDPDGDALTFSATSSDEARVRLDSSADTIWIKGASEGTARVTATATDVPGLSAAQAFDVTVRPFVAPTGFDIQLGFTSSVSASARGVIREAASTWESILANTELSDVNFNRRVSCGGVTTTGAVGTVDDLLILFTAESIDGPRGSLGYAGPCTVRTSNSLPIVGRVVLDSEDIDRIPATTGLLDLVIHEIAHVLGFGLLWDDFGLLADPSSVTPGADTHFTGAGAIAAFNAAGGASYTGAKVPVDNEEPGPDGHWRASIFRGEAMSPAQFLSRREPLSAITIESLADLGYTVAAALADPYSVSLPDIPPGRPVQAEAGRIIYLGDDILRMPIQVVDDEGRVLRVIPPR